MATGSEGPSTVEFDELFPPRIDQLVESALQDQAREQAMLMDTVQGAQREMKLLRELIERRDQAVVDLLEARLSGLASERNLEKISDLVTQIKEEPDPGNSFAPMFEEMGALDTHLTTLGGRLEALEKGLEKMDPWKPALEVQRALTQRLSEIAADIRDHVDERYTAVGERIDAATKGQLEQLGKRWETISALLQDASKSLQKGLGSFSAELKDATVLIKGDVKSATSKLDGVTSDLQGRLDKNAETIAKQLDEKTAQLPKLVEGKLQDTSKLVTDKSAETSKLITEKTAQTSKLITDKSAETTRAVSDKAAETSKLVRDKAAETSKVVSDKAAETSKLIDEKSTETAKLLEEGNASLSRLVTNKQSLLTESIKDQSTALTDLLNERSSSLSEQLTDVSASISERLGAVVERTGAVGEQLSSSTEALQEAIDAAGALAEESKDSLTNIKADLRESIEVTGARTFDRLVKMHSEAGKLAESLKRLSTWLEDRLDESSSADQNRSATLSKQIEDSKQTILKQSAGIDKRIDAQTDRVAGEIFEHMEGFHRSLKDETDRALDAVASTVEPFATVVRRLAKRVQDSNRRITDSNARVESLYESLLAYLVQRDQYLEHARDQVLLDLMEQLGEHLRRRDRAKVTEALKRAEEARKDRRDALSYRKLKGAQRKPPGREDVAVVAQQIEAARPKEEEEPMVMPVEVTAATPTSAPRTRTVAAPVKKKAAKVTNPQSATRKTVAKPKAKAPAKGKASPGSRRGRS